MITQQPVTADTSVDLEAAKSVQSDYKSVTTEDVLKRIYATFKPFSPEFSNQISGNPDLVGPFWIVATLVVLIQIVSPIINGDFTIATFPIAIVFLFSFAIGVPAALIGIYRIAGCPDIGFMNLLVVYGYSLSVLVPVTIACIIPLGVIFEILLIIYAFVNSTIVVLWNIQEDILRGDMQKRIIMISSVVALQIALYVQYPIYFL